MTFFFKFCFCILSHSRQLPVTAGSFLIVLFIKCDWCFILLMFVFKTETAHIHKSR